MTRQETRFRAWVQGRFERDPDDVASSGALRNLRATQVYDHLIEAFVAGWDARKPRVPVGRAKRVGPFKRRALRTKR